MLQDIIVVYNLQADEKSVGKKKGKSGSFKQPK